MAGRSIVDAAARALQRVVDVDVKAGIDAASLAGRMTYVWIRPTDMSHESFKATYAFARAKWAPDVNCVPVDWTYSCCADEKTNACLYYILLCFLCAPEPEAHALLFTWTIEPDVRSADSKTTLLKSTHPPPPPPPPPPPAYAP